MSTRCQLRFTEMGTDHVAQVYRHSDGYPESVIFRLVHLRNLLHRAGAQRDSSYTAAQFVFIDKLWSLNRSFEHQDGIYSELPETVSEVLETEGWQEVATSPTYLLGHGVEDPSCGIHGDEEFLYIVELPENRHEDWRVKIAGKDDFSRFDEDGTDSAFKTANWRFSGTLEEASAEVQDT